MGFGPIGEERLSELRQLGSDSMDMAGADPDYIMQLVNEVRRFADGLLHLKEAFNTKGKSETAQGWRKSLLLLS